MYCGLKRLAMLLMLGAAIICAGLLFFRAIPDALATGGAFPYTKHGGGTVDGLPFSGVNRAVNPDWGIYYNEAAEGGQYLPGECTHCHEPHASFGAAEPAPNTGNDAGPDLYLLMKDYGGNDQTNRNYAELCWYCHESINFDPILGGGTGFYKFYQGKAVYQLTTHFTSANFYWPGTGGGDPVAIWPRGDRTGLPSGNKGSCLNCHTPHGILEQSGSEFDTAAVPASGPNRHLAANNASVSTDYLIPRQLIAWEEGLCENCHDASGPSVNDIQAEIDKRGAGGSGHPVDDTALSARHVVNEALPITTKHVECYDCHNPHADKPPTGALGDGDGGRVKGMRYVDINGVMQDPAMGARQPYVYEVCLKCHGDSFDCTMPYIANGAGTMQPACPDGPFRHRGLEDGAGNNSQMGSSNKRKEFDPTTVIGAAHGADNTKINGAYHPVAAPGRNISIQLCNQLSAAFGLNCANQAAATASLQNLTINCTDCHNTEATSASVGPVTESNLRTTDKNTVYAGASPIGPHGSTNKRILRANYRTYIGSNSCFGHEWGGGPNTAAMPTNFALCFRCHSITPFNTRFPGSQWTNFYAGAFGNWSGSLHWYHLSCTTADPIVCHECHNNVHSNVEANNTQYYSGGACCTNYTADNNLHLINFGPQASPASYAKPAWYYSGGVFQCNLTCHGKNMSACAYRGAFDGGLGGGGWC